jgi:DNA-binding LytR/AlgR family response regulator
MNEKKLRAILVDDEKPARARLARMLAQFPEIEIVGEAQDGVAALELIDNVKPEVIFLDIEMPELDGLGVARSLGQDGPAIVFVTAYDEYALKAFDMNTVDYLVKPVAEGRLEVTIQKLLKRRGHLITPTNSAQNLEVVLKQLNVNRSAKFAVRSGAKFVICDPQKISAIIAKDHYSAILMDGRELLSDDTLEEFEKKLNGGRFIRVHRSAMINLDYLHELEREGDRKYVAILSQPEKTRVPISRERLDEVKSKLGLA